jgi:polar amino acid transport system substrate-binding protein
VQSYKQQTDVTTALVTGKVDALYADSRVTGYAIEQTGDNCRRSRDQGRAPQPSPSRRVTLRPMKPSRRLWQKLIDDGTYGKILKSWEPSRSHRQGRDQSDGE